MTRPAAHRKDGPTMALMGLVLACPTAAFALVGDALATVVLVFAGLVVSASVRRPLDRSARSYVYTILAALVVTVGQHQFLPASAEQFFLMPGEVYCPMLLYLAVSLTFFDTRESVVAAVVALAVLTTMIAGNVVSFEARGSALRSAVENLDGFHRFYGVVVLCETLAILVLLGRCAHCRAQDSLRGKGWLSRKVVYAACLVLVLGVVVALRLAAVHSQQQLQDMLAGFLRRYAQRRVSRTVFGRDVDLWRTAGLRGRQDQTVLLRVRGRRAPGYLRGYVYRFYEAGRWRADDTGTALSPVEGQNGPRVTTKAFERFSPPPEEEAIRLDVLPASGFRSQVLLASGDAGRVELVCPLLRNTDDGELTPGEWDRRTGYVLVVPASPRHAAYPKPGIGGPTPGSYLGVPPYLVPGLQPVADEAFRDLPENASAGATVAALIQHMRRNYRYELGVRMDLQGGDPVLQFLNRTRRGHCELFAASTALLLRLRGIPTRYVTGFVCVERPMGGHHYLSRLQDAHAWVEAYDSSVGRWVLVEPTPPSGVPQSRTDTSLVWSLLDSLRMAWQQMLALMRRGYIAAAIASFVGGLWACLMAAFADPVRATVASALLLLLVGWLVRRSRRRRSVEVALQGEDRWRLRRGRKWLLRQFRSAGQIPEPSDSLRNLLVKLASSDAALASRLAPAVGEYERLRYGPEQPSVKDVLAFERTLREARRDRR